MPRIPGNLPLELFASRDHEVERLAGRRRLHDVFPWFLSFDRLVKETDFVESSPGRPGHHTPFDELIRFCAEIGAPEQDPDERYEYLLDEQE